MYVWSIAQNKKVTLTRANSLQPVDAWMLDQAGGLQTSTRRSVPENIY
jgi:hypothetical protein